MALLPRLRAFERGYAKPNEIPMHVRPSLEQTLLVLLDHLVGTRDERRRHGEAERLSGLKVDN